MTLDFAAGQNAHAKPTRGVAVVVGEKPLAALGGRLSGANQLLSEGLGRLRMTGVRRSRHRMCHGYATVQVGTV